MRANCFIADASFRLSLLMVVDTITDTHPRDVKYVVHLVCDFNASPDGRHGIYWRERELREVFFEKRGSYAEVRSV
jgi:hypothetical protein